MPYINFAPKCHFPLEFENLNSELGMPVTPIFFLSFYLEGHITRNFSLKNQRNLWIDN